MASKQTVEVKESMLLDLDAEEAALTRQTVRVDGNTYELRTNDDLSMVEKEELRCLLMRSQQVGEYDETEMSLEERRVLLGDLEERMVRLVLLNAPADLTIGSDYKRSKLLSAFTVGLGDSLLPLFVQMLNAAATARRNRLENPPTVERLKALPTAGEPLSTTDAPIDVSPPGSSSSIAAD